MTEINPKICFIVAMIVVVVGAGVGFGIWVVQQERAPSDGSNACISNLVFIEGAKQQWASEHKTTNTPTVAELTPYLRRGHGSLPVCGSDPAKSFATSYKINPMNAQPSCRINPDTHVFPESYIEKK